FASTSPCDAFSAASRHGGRRERRERCLGPVGACSMPTPEMFVNAKIEVRSVSKAFVSLRTGERVEALRDVSFSLQPHEFVSIVGPSGCGKSTLLSLVAGFISPSAGDVLEDGARIAGPDPRRGVMFQDYALFPWRTVLGNVEFGPLARGASREAMRATAQRYVELVGLAGFEQRYPHELSGGMRQRCALARLLANEPDVWLMDEPL